MSELVCKEVEFSLSNLRTRESSPVQDVELRKKLEEATRPLFAAQLETRLRELQRSPSPPRRVDDFTLFYRGYFEFAPKGPPPELTKTPPSSSYAPTPGSRASPVQTLLTPSSLEDKRSRPSHSSKPERKRMDKKRRNPERSKVLKLVQGTRTHKMDTRMRKTHGMKTRSAKSMQELMFLFELDQAGRCKISSIRSTG
jgi:hypothetical protein